MAKFSFIKNNFQAGQLSPKLKGRQDIQEYPNGAELIKNFMVMPEGGASKRSGTVFKADIISDMDAIYGANSWGYQSTGFRLIPFIDSESNSYVLAIGDIDFKTQSKELVDLGSGNKLIVPIALYTSSGSIITASSGYITVGGASPAFDGLVANSMALWDGIITSKDGWQFTQEEDVIVLTHSSNLVPPIIFNITRVTYTGSSALTIIPYSYERWSNDNTAYTSYGNTNRGLTTAYRLPNRTSSAVAVTNTTNPDINANASENIFNIGMANTYLKIVDSGGVEGLFRINPTSFIETLATSNYDTTNNRINFVGHKVKANDPVRFVADAGGSIPSDLDENTTYYAINVNANDFQFSTTVGGPAVTLSDVGSGTSFLFYLETDKINTTSSVLVGASGTYTDFTLSAWDYTNQGWPAVCGGYQSRFIFGSTLKQKGGLWFSRLGRIFHFMERRLNQDLASSTDVSGLDYFGNLSDTDAFSRDLSEDVDTSLSWIRAKRNLHVGTLFAEYIIGGSDGIFGPNTVYASKQTDYGGTREQASGYGNASLFVTRNGKGLRDFRYSENNGSNISRNLSVLSDQILYSGFVSGDYHSTAFKSLAWNNTRSTLFLLNSLGKLLTIGLEDSGGVTAWAEQDISGADSIHGVAVIPNSNADYDDVFLCVERTIDGNTVQYLEVIQRTFEHPVLNNTSTLDADKCVFLDSAKIIDLGASGTAVSGLDHLEGQTVRVVGDGANLGTYTVSSGAITLTTSARYLIIGLDYESEIITMPIEAGSVTGSSQSYLKRVDQVHFKLFRSKGGKYGFKDNLYDIEYPDHSEDTFSGHIRSDFDSTNDYEYAVQVKHTEPFPFNLLSINMRGVTEE